jgi:hypothetical protein
MGLFVAKFILEFLLWPVYHQIFASPMIIVLDN